MQSQQRTLQRSAAPQAQAFVSGDQPSSGQRAMSTRSATQPPRQASIQPPLMQLQRSAPQITQQKEGVDMLRQKFEEMARRTQTAEVRYATKVQELARQETVVTKQREELTRLQQQCEQLRNQLEDQQRKQADAKIALNASRKLCESIHQKIMQGGQSLDEAKGAREQLQNAYGELKSGYDTLTSCMQELSLEKATLQTHHGEAMARLRELDEEVQRFTNKIQELQDKLLADEEKRSQLETSLARVKNELEAALGEKATIKSEAEKTIAALQHSVTNYEAQTTELSTELQSKIQEITGLQDVVAQLGAQYAELKTQHDVEKQELMARLAKLEEQQGHYEKLATEKKSLEEMYGRLQADLEVAHNELAALREQHASLQGVSHEAQQLSAQLEAERTAHRQLQSDVINIDQRLEAAVTRLASMETQCHDLTVKLQDVRVEADMARANCLAKEQELLAAQARARANENVEDNLRAEIAELQKQLVQRLEDADSMKHALEDARTMLAEQADAMARLEVEHSTLKRQKAATQLDDAQFEEPEPRATRKDQTPRQTSNEDENEQSMPQAAKTLSRPSTSAKGGKRKAYTKAAPFKASDHGRHKKETAYDSESENEVMPRKKDRASFSKKDAMDVDVLQERQPLRSIGNLGQTVTFAKGTPRTGVLLASQSGDISSSGKSKLPRDTPLAPANPKVVRNSALYVPQPKDKTGKPKLQARLAFMQIKAVKGSLQRSSASGGTEPINKNMDLFADDPFAFDV